MLDIGAIFLQLSGRFPQKIPSSLLADKRKRCAAQPLEVSHVNILTAGKFALD